MKKILLVDDDLTFCQVLAQSLEEDGYKTFLAENIEKALSLNNNSLPNLAIIDLKIGNQSGLELIPLLLKDNPDIKIIILTGYAGIPTAIEAIKLGALHYLSKPVSKQEIIEAFNKNKGNPHQPIEDKVTSLSNAENEHIINTLKRNNGNISATARELGIYRRTLQRKLDKMRFINKKP